MFIIVGYTRGGRKLYYGGLDPSEWTWTEYEDEATHFGDEESAKDFFLILHNSHKRISATWFEISLIEKSEEFGR